MTELDLILIRQREHECVVSELRIAAAKIQDDVEEICRAEANLAFLETQENDQVKRLESKGHDYFTITAEMARIRAEVIGEK